MRILVVILIFLELIFALIAFTPIFINSENTVQSISQAEVKVKNNPTPENEAALSNAKAKLNWELWIEKITFFGAIVFSPGAMAVVITMALIFRRRNVRAIQN